MKRILILVIVIIIPIVSILANNRINNKGIGVAFLKVSLPGNMQYKDSILLFDSTFINTIGCFKFDNNDTLERFRLISNEIIENTLFEFAYETLGLPILEKCKDKLKILIGTDKLGVSITAWIRLNEKSLGYYFWENYLVKQELFFLNTNSMYFFYDLPQGKRIDFKLIKDNSEFSEYLEKEFEYNYIMHPIEKRERWLKVEVVTPSDFCEDVLNPKKKTFWIKYLDENGYPLVWYYTRGC